MKNKKAPEEYSKRFSPNYEIGLSDDEVNYQKEHGQVNVSVDYNSKSYLRIIWDNVFTFFNILELSIFILFVLSGYWLSSFFFVVPFLNTIMGTAQECKAKRTISKLKLITMPKIKLVRNSIQSLYDPKEIVRDDILHLYTGDQIPVDCYLVNGNIETNEALLTGESLPIKKNKNDFLYGGSFVVSGECYAIADKVGNNTYIASIEGKAKGFKKPKSKLITSIMNIIKKLAIIIIPLSILTFWNAWVNGSIGKYGWIIPANFGGPIEIAGSSAIGMIPSGMILLSSLAMAVAVIKLGNRNTLVSDLYSVESLARVNTLCFDKTGTITDGTMTVEDTYFFSDIHIDRFQEVIGSYLDSCGDTNQTAEALINKFGRSGYYQPKKILNFSSSRKYSAVEFENGDIYALGAPEFLKLDKGILNTAKLYTVHGLRVLAFVKVKGTLDLDDGISGEKQTICLFCLRDNIRPEAKDTINWFYNNHVDIKIISGDNIQTVAYIAKEAGVRNYKAAVSLDTIDEKDLENVVMNNSIFGRVTPEQKAQIVDILHAHGRQVAITGDGINDVLAMKKSDCAIAMQNGASATKSVANVVLLDSNFSSMPATVMEGRRVVNNIQRSSTLFLMKTFFTMFLTIFCLFVRINFPKVNIWIISTFVTGIGSTFLSLEPSSSEIKGSFTKNILVKAIPAGFFIFLPALFLIIYAFVYCSMNPVSSNIVTDVNNYFSIAVNIAPISLCISIAGFIIFFNTCRPFTKYRRAVFLTLTIISVLLLLSYPTPILENGSDFQSYIMNTYFEGNIIGNFDSEHILNFINSEFLNLSNWLNLYKEFSIQQWYIIIIFTALSYVFYYFSVKGITKFLSKPRIDKFLFENSD